MPLVRAGEPTTSTRALRVRRQPIRLRGASGPFEALLPGDLTAVTPQHFFATGVRIQIGDTAAARVTMSPFRYAERADSPDVIEATFVLQGAVTATCATGPRLVPSGSLVFSRLRRGDSLVTTADSTLLRLIAPAAAFATDILVAEDLPLLVPQPQYANALSQIVKGVIGDDDLTEGFKAGPVRDALLAIMQFTLVTAVNDSTTAPPASLRDLALAHIDAHFPDPGVSATTVALDLGVGLRTLQAAFSSDTAGIALHLRTRRLEAAAERLRTSTAQKYSDIARDTGFSGADHLARAFSNHFGCSLTEYRTRHHEPTAETSPRAPEEVRRTVSAGGSSW